MNRANAIEIAGFVAGFAGIAVIAYGCWLIAPVLMWFYVGAALAAAGTGMVWLGNGGPR